MITHPKKASAFTVLELMLVMAIMALLATLLVPVAEHTMKQARSTACVSNLRQIGASFHLYLADHNNIIPKVESNEHNPVYLPEEDAKTFLEAFGPYGVTEKILKCPADAASGPEQNYYAKAGTSYMWRPFFDGGDAGALVMISRDGTERSVSPGRARIVLDAYPVHFGRNNFLYVDGKVVAVKPVATPAPKPAG